MIKRPLPPTVRPLPTTPSTPGIQAGNGGCIPHPLPHFPNFPVPHPVPGTTLKPADRFNAWGLKRGLEQATSGIAGAIALSRAPKSSVKVGLDGTATGPEGQPLVTVRLANGKTAYVDPNTNEYYLKTQQQGGKLPFGQQAVHGPMALPKDLQFSNSNFSVADCKQLSLDANRPPLRRIELPEKRRWIDLVKSDAFDAGKAR